MLSRVPGPQAQSRAFALPWGLPSATPRLSASRSSGPCLPLPHVILITHKAPGEASCLAHTAVRGSTALSVFRRENTWALCFLVTGGLRCAETESISSDFLLSGVLEDRLCLFSPIPSAQDELERGESQ